jgi:hypothetical protein
MLYVDNSMLRAAARCDTELMLRYLLGYTTPDEGPPLRAGIAAHEALAAHLRGASRNEALAVFRGHYAAWAEAHVDPEGPLQRLTYENTATILAQWLRTRPLTSLPFEVHPDLVEVGFAVPLLDGVIFCGRLDALVIDRERREFYVLDHKTTGRLDATWARQFRNDSQLSGYVWAAQQHTGNRVVGAFINGIEFARLPSDPTRKCRDHGVAYAECRALHAKHELLIVQRTAEQLDQWTRSASELARRVQRLAASARVVRDISATMSHAAQQGMFHGACAWCQFQDFCAAGRPATMLPAFLHEPWQPYERAMTPAVVAAAEAHPHRVGLDPPAS